MARIIASQLSRLRQPSLIGAVGAHPEDPVVERWGPVAVVVLAAGGSSRMGRAKQLLHVDGESMIVRAVKIALQSTATEVVVITGAYREEVEAEVRRELAPLLSQAPSRVRLVHNPNWEERTGVEHPCCDSSTGQFSRSRNLHAGGSAVRAAEPAALVAAALADGA